jgi:choline dehydrogenase-like flavoprotein
VPEEIADVLIIGSGHSGGTAAKVLTEKGITCLLLNAGPVVDFEKDRKARPSYELPYRGFQMPGRLPHVWQSRAFNANVWVDEKEVPYTYPRGKAYNMVRVRLFGGRSLFWGRYSYRLSDYEFKCKDHDGFGENWPVDLAEMAPYYSRCERILRVLGYPCHLPQYPDGNFVLDTSSWSGAMKRFIAAAKQRNIPVCKPRAALGKDGLASSVNLLLPDAFATGRLSAVPNVVVRQITVDKNTGLVNGVHAVDRHSRREMHFKAKRIVLAAGCLESTRLLLNSAIANSSGVLGHYLSDQVYGVGITCSVPEARDGKATPALMGGSDGFIPQFRNIATREKNFLRGYSLNLVGAGFDQRSFPLYGAELQKKLDSYEGSGFATGIMGAVLPYYKHCVTIDKNTVEAWNIPVLHVDTEYTENEFNMARDAIEVSKELAQAAGFDVVSVSEKPNPPGYSIHQMGTCRMGDNPKTSVLNQWNQSHDIKNLFVVDASAFVYGGWQNPTLTMMSLSMRASEYLAEQMRRGDV